MADEHEPNEPADFERYFSAEGGGADTGPLVPVVDGDFGQGIDGADGVVVGGVPAPRVPVHIRTGGHRRDAAAPSGRRRRFVTVAGCMSVAVLLVSGASWAYEGHLRDQVHKIDVAGLGKSANSGPKGAMNILVAGVDRREGLTTAQENALHLGHDAGARSDTMELVHLSADHRHVSVISLPRDSYVTIPAHRSNGDEGPKGARVPARYGKLNWAYEFGGSNLTVAAVKKATGLDIDHYVEVNFFGFVNVVNALGGVNICTPTALNDPKSGLVLPAGESHVDGVQALAYARARYTLGDGSDLGRIDRQQKFMATLLHTAVSGSTLSNPVKLVKFTDALLSSLSIDKGLGSNLTELADQMKSISGNDVTFAKIPLADEDYRARLWNAAGLQSTVRWDTKGAAALFASVREDQVLDKPQPAPSKSSATPSATPGNGLTVPPKRITLRVANGVGTVGLAKNASDSLRKAGFSTVVLPGVAQTGLAHTVVEYGPGRADSARTVAAAIPGAKVKQLNTIGSTIQVVVGKDWTGARKVQVADPTPVQIPSIGPANTPPSATTASQNVLCK